MIKHSEAELESFVVALTKAVLPMLVSKSKKKKASLAAEKFGKVLTRIISKYTSDDDHEYTRMIMSESDRKKAKEITESVDAFLAGLDMFLSDDEDPDKLLLSDEFSSIISRCPAVIVPIIVNVFRKIVNDKYGQLYNDSASIIGDYLFKIYNSSCKSKSNKNTFSFTEKKNTKIYKDVKLPDDDEEDGYF